MSSTTDPLKPLRALRLAPDVRPARELGHVGNLAMLPVSALVVDTRYQRDIRFGGVQNITRIVEEFDWRRFGVIVVARVEGGRYAVIDGQHRATAALLHPDIDMVPAYVIDADLPTAARVFAALNGARTAMTSGDLFHARTTAGEQLAVEVTALCRETGIVPLRAKATNMGWKPGETFAVVALQRVFVNHGADIARAVFAALAHPKHAGSIRAPLIYALAEIVAADRQWLAQDLTALLARVRLADLVVKASAAAKEAHAGVRAVLRPMLERSLRAAADRKAAKTPAPAEELAPA